ncbi:Protein of unknown function [Gryllus bimaculatus]|nr:Protein of unknown function [Gryllus bimaculatus]
MELTEMRPAPNPGDIVTLPMVDREEAKQVVSGILEEILSNVKARPPVYTGFNSYRYYDDCGIMMYPQMPPLLIQKNNLDELVLRPGQRYSHTMTYVFSALPRPPARKRRRFGRQRPFKRASELMIDHCSAASSLEGSKASFSELLDICSVHTSLASI